MQCGERKKKRKKKRKKNREEKQVVIFFFYKTRYLTDMGEQTEIYEIKNKCMDPPPPPSLNIVY